MRVPGPLAAAHPNWKTTMMLARYQNCARGLARGSGAPHNPHPRVQEVNPAKAMAKVIGGESVHQWAKWMDGRGVVNFCRCGKMGERPSEGIGWDCN